ncbi:M6 family metalloprotease domain-containing protein [Pedococcus bigeumensis]|uniref:M6 family metalloprotease domain-containing protein n=1 Tax=Pedococcus bigeumensis TaxID=433644 RepID=A0A502D5R1_9MICO|nr:M6 family metalloprotease domain-containing protein [Pedococcus bigeumensis]TPG19331.1 M6 family metalloprotease domain-containing protein [Pedococcus bigeumensis]
MQARRVITIGAALAAGLLSVPIGLPAAAAPPPSPHGPRPQSVRNLPVADVRGAPVDTSPRVLTQPDGTALTVRAVGDGVSHGVETLDGYAVVQTPTGRWEYAAGRAANGKLKPSGKVVGRDRPAVGTAKHQRDVAATPTTTLVPAALNTGTQRTLVILVQFTNQASVGSTPAQWSGKYFGPGNSVRSYYQQASGNQLDFAPAAESSGTPNDGVVGWLTLPYAHPNFGGNFGAVVNGLLVEKQLTRDAILAADPYVNFASYDTNGDGNLQPSELHLTVIVAGYESSVFNSCGPSVWGHKSNLYGSYTPMVDNVWAGNLGYTQFGEWHRTCSTATWNNMATIGIMAHEIGHDLGWPDLYDTVPGGNNPDSSGIGAWSVMSGGSWGTVPGQNIGDSPVLPDAWSRSFQGWVTPTPVGASTTVMLRSASTSLDAVRLRDNPNGVDWAYGASGSGEYFLVENRQRTGFDAALPGCGLLVWHVDETRPGDNSANSDELRRLVDLEQADGLKQLDAPGQDGDSGDPFPGSTHNLAFTGATNPDSNLYSGAGSGVSMSLTNQACAPSMSATVAAVVGTAPENDGFATAQVLPGSSGNVTGTSVGATKESGEPDHAGNPGGASVWYSWTAPTSGKLTLSSAGSSFDTLMGVYQGSTVSALTERGSNDDENHASGVVTSRIADLAVTGGQVYRIAVDGFKDGVAAAEAGTVKVAWSFAATPPANDAFAAAQVWSGSSGSVTGTSLGATKESGEPDHAGNPGGASVWYSWTAPSSGKLTLSSAGSSFDTLMGVYQGTSVSALTLRASNDDEDNAGGLYTSKVTDLAVTGGQAYRIAVDGYQEGAAAAEAGAVKVAWSFAATPPEPSHFTPLTPARLLDTRSGVGAPKAAVAAGGTVSLKVAGLGGVPATGVGAVVLNVTVAQPSAAGFVTVWPAGEGRPVTSNLNFVKARTVPNLVVVKVGAGGFVDLYNSSGSTQLIADVMGWFPEGSDFTGVSPTRLLDTRSGNGTPQGPVPGGQAVSVDVTGRGGVPATGVGAVVLNVTVTGPTTSGYVTVWPHVQSRPATSNLNFSPGQTVPNLVIVKVGPDGLVDLFNSAGQTHLLADVMGWFPDGSEFTGLTPARLLDTRSGVGAPKAAVAAGGTVSLKVAGLGGVPATGVGAVVLNVTVAQPSAAGFVTVWPAGEGRPVTSNLNFVKAQTVPNLVVVKVGAGGFVDLYNSSGSTQLIADVMGWFPTP